MIDQQTIMIHQQTTRRGFLRTAGQAAGAVATCCLGTASAAAAPGAEGAGRRGTQRLSLDRIKQFESLGYGMFISYDIEAFCRHHLLSKDLTEDQLNVPPQTFAPDKLDVDQWVSVARDAGMKYAILTAKRYSGFCLWPSKRTNYTVANSGNKTDIVERLIASCEKRGVLPGLYYNSYDIHHRFGRPHKEGWSYTTSRYQTFMTEQLTELLTGYGPIAEVWIDMPVCLGRGYRTFLYEHIARLQSDAVIMMNLGIQDGTDIAKKVECFWPSDLISIERRLPPGTGHRKWWTIEGREYYLPGEVCDSIMHNWYWREGDKPRRDDKVLAQFQACRERGVNLLLDAPPNNHGVIPRVTVEALMRLRRSAGI